jgi:hypothetical protein
MDDEPIWYVASGSNLFRDRLGCHLAGGRPSGGARHYQGCRDPRPARSGARGHWAPGEVTALLG